MGDYDIILSCLEGVSTRRLFHCVSPLSAHRPLIISIFAGLVLRYRNDGYSVRQRSDLLWLNCQADMDAYAEMCDGFGLSPSNARLFGNASLLRKIDRDRKSTRLNSSPLMRISYAVFCLKKKKSNKQIIK